MSFAHPSLLYLLPVVWVVVVLLELRVPARPVRRLARTLIRALGLSLLVLAAAGPERGAWRGLGRRLVIAVDRSSGMSLLAREEALTEARRAADEARAGGAAVTLLGFARTAAAGYELPAHPTSANAGTDGWPTGPGGAWPLPAAGAEATPVPEPEPAAAGYAASGLAAAHLAFRPGERGAVLLLTTGRNGLAGVEEAARRLEAAGIRLHSVALPREVPPPPPRARVETIDLPDTVRGPFTVHATVSGPGPLEVELLLDGESRGVRILPAGDAGARGRVSFEDQEAKVGVHEVAVVVRRVEAEDRTDATLDRRLLTVEPPPRTLALLEEPETSPTRRALGAQDFTMETVPAEALAKVLGADGPRPEAIVLDAASAAHLPPKAQVALVRALEAGVGLFLEPGGDEEAWEALADTPLARVLPVEPVKKAPEPPPTPEVPPATPEAPDVDPPEETDDPGLAAEQRPEEALPISLLLVLDRSGSMRGPKLGMALEGARRAAMTLSEFDRLGIVTFADDATLDIPPTSTRRLGNLAWRLALIQATGNTDLYGALAKAVAVMERETAPIRHVIFLTDGVQVGSEPIFGPLMKQMARSGITLTAVGLGPDHDGKRLKQIVQFSPRGRYIPVDTEARLPTILTRDTQKIAEYRLREAKAMARIRDPDQEPTPRPPKDEPRPPTPPTPPDPDPPAPEPEPVPEAPALARLHLLRPHEATRGIDEEALPSVGPPRRSRPRRGAALLLVRGEEGEPVLTARRVGLGRVMVFALPADAEGVESWPDLGRVLVQGVRSVRAPRGVFGGMPSGRILRGPDGERLALDASSNPGAGPVRVEWRGADGPRDLGTFLPGQEVVLPPAPPGTAAVVHVVPEDGTPPGPPLTYLAADPNEAGPQAGDATALRAAVGGGAQDAPGPLLPPVGREPDPRPLWPLALALAALLLPLDAALHRRCEEGSPS